MSHTKVKTCCRCRLIKEAANKHHPSYCADCLRSVRREYYRRKMLDPVWRSQERKRCRIKQIRRAQNGTIKPVPAEKQLQYQRRSKARFPDKRKARGALGRAVIAGRIIRENCEVCGKPQSQAHHPDYSKPYEVKWLCSSHHAELHHKE